jgi:hypothetical protein
VSSPAFFDDPATTSDDALSDLAGQYEYFYAKALLFDIAPEGFRTVATNGQHAARRQLQSMLVNKPDSLAQPRHDGTPLD